MNTDHKKVITRIPPSPTGHLHIGTARTALFNYLFAKSHNGEVVFRCEDTDSERSKREFEDEIIEGLNWLGIYWDNTVVRQSERKDIYTKYIDTLIGEGKAYISEEVSKKDISQTVSVVRLKNPGTVITFTDSIRGDITFDTTELGDFVIARSVTDPLYHLTVVVDDELMGVTHVLRGEDHISNTPRQILIQEALGFERPTYGHLPLILAPDRSKMSKRHGAVAIHEYKNMGILPDAILNYLALLGWNPGTDQEIFTLDELVSIFTINKVQKGGAIFNLEKLLWLNKEHIAKQDTDFKLHYVMEAFKETDFDIDEIAKVRIQKITPTVLERHSSKAEIKKSIEENDFDYLFMTPEFDPTLLTWKNDTDINAYKPRLMAVREILESADFSSPEKLKESLWSYVEKTGKGEVLWPLRVSLSGKKQSPDPFTLLYVLDKEESIKRVSACV